ncbi:MAG: hypothetical protein PHC68_05545 [Syntrophorhabdaceae bacterium]|nr:hypothetical protein [Syntrophorhabdaceae bacterium]
MHNKTIKATNDKEAFSALDLMLFSSWYGNKEVNPANYNQILCMAIKKTYPLLSSINTILLAKGGKRRIRLMKNNDPVDGKKQEKEEPRSVLEEIIAVCLQSKGRMGFCFG